MQYTWFKVFNFFYLLINKTQPNKKNHLNLLSCKLSTGSLTCPSVCYSWLHPYSKKKNSYNENSVLLLFFTFVKRNFCYSSLLSRYIFFCTGRQVISKFTILMCVFHSKAIWTISIYYYIIVMSIYRAGILYPSPDLYSRTATQLDCERSRFYFFLKQDFEIWMIQGSTD